MGAPEGFEWNPFLISKIRPIIRDNWVFVDVGANHGEFTDFFSSLNYEKIFVIEMNSNLVHFLKEKYKDRKNIFIENYAVSDKEGIIDYYDGGYNKSDACYNIMGHSTTFEPGKKLGEVNSIKLEDFFQKQRIDLMKIDIEGAEIKILHGLQNIIKNIHYILLECHIDRDWGILNKILLKDLKLTCKNLYDGDVITENSSRPYQCLCINERFYGT